MKFMKLGSKPDSFQANGDNIRYVATELATDIAINVGDVKFYLHKFPLLSKSARLQKLVASTSDENSDEVHISDFPGGPAAFEICAKFCYGMTVTLNAYNVVSARCASEYLEMYENIEKGNLIYKIEVFLSSSIFRSWKDSIIVLQTTKNLLPWAEELKIVTHCLESIASKACIDTTKVDWSYTYNKRKLPSENGKDPVWNGQRKPQNVPRDWWVEDLCELQIDLYKRVITGIKTKGIVSGEIIGEALNAYALRRLPSFSKGAVQSNEIVKYRYLVETIMCLLPTEKNSVSCSFMLRLLRAAIQLECRDSEKNELMKRIGQNLEDATVGDLLIRAPSGEKTIYAIDIVKSLVEEFRANFASGFEESRSLKLGSDASKMQVAKLIEGYLAEVSRDPNMPIIEFVNLAEKVSSFHRPTHDGLYRAIDMYLKEHPGISKSERKRICRLMDCRKLSPEACAHAVQNERLPLRVVVQVLFFEQVRQAPPGGNATPEPPGPIGSQGSSRSTTTNTEEDWDNLPSAEDIKALKGQLATLQNGAEKVNAGKMKGVVMSRLFSKLWSGKDRSGEISSSETSESPGSASAEETKSSTPSRSRRHSLS